MGDGLPVVKVTVTAFGRLAGRPQATTTVVVWARRRGASGATAYGVQCQWGDGLPVWGGATAYGCPAGRPMGAVTAYE